MTNKISEGFASEVEIEDAGTPRIERTEGEVKTIVEKAPELRP